ncbi:MAG: PEP-CTERM sorting domain-containing protein [Planctomycetaceae bacterium]|nr:PEP-CTERM sorting domain-containing protein [Planctomycetaceae bacterium]
MKKITCLLSCLLVIGCAGSAFGWAEWNYAGGSHSWDNAANWGGTVPTAGDDPIMRDAGAGGYAEVGPGVNAVGNMMWMYGGGQADLNVNGGTLSLGQLRIAVDGGDKTVNVSDGGTINLASDSTIGQGGTGTLNVTGGSVNQTGGWTYIGFGGTGYVTVQGSSVVTFGAIRGWNGGITVNGGTLRSNGDTTLGEGSSSFDLTINGGLVDQTAGALFVGFATPGGVHLNGGILSINNLLLDGSAGEYFDINGGTLIYKDARPEDIAFQINWYAGQGYITVNGGQSAVGMLNFAVDENNYTHVTAIPEPITMLLLGIGGLFIRRK